MCVKLTPFSDHFSSRCHIESDVSWLQCQTPTVVFSESGNWDCNQYTSHLNWNIINNQINIVALTVCVRFHQYTGSKCIRFVFEFKNVMHPRRFLVFNDSVFCMEIVNFKLCRELQLQLKLWRTIYSKLRGFQIKTFSIFVNDKIAQTWCFYALTEKIDKRRSLKIKMPVAVLVLPCVGRGLYSHKKLK